MPYCPHCGNEVDTLPGAAAVEDREPVEVTLARIEAEKAITIAKLSARESREWNESREAIAETEADAQVEAVTAIAEIITAENEPEPEAEPAPEPIVIEAPAPEPEPDNAPPPVEHHAPRKSGGWWDNYA